MIVLFFFPIHKIIALFALHYVMTELECMHHACVYMYLHLETFDFYCFLLLTLFNLMNFHLKTILFVIVKNKGEYVLHVK